MAILNDTILINHGQFAHTDVDLAGGLIYTGDWSDGSAGAPDLIEVVPPQVRARIAPMTPRIRIARRAGHADIVVAPGDSLVFYIDLGPNPEQAPQSQHWVVEIRSDSPSYQAVFSDTTSVPARLAFPQEMIPVDWVELQVRVRIAEAWQAWAGHGSYEVRLTVDSDLRWTVRRADGGYSTSGSVRRLEIWAKRARRVSIACPYIALLL
jgi:hypothetical protein